MKLHKGMLRSRLAAGRMPALNVDFSGHFLTLVKKVFEVQDGAHLVALVFEKMLA